MKNYILFPFLLGVISLLFIQATSSPNLAETSKDLGIFDIQNETKIQTSVDFNNQQSGGISTYQTTRISPSELKITHHFERKKSPNPFVVEYSFDVKKISNHNYEMNIKGAMPLQSLNISSDIETIYQGTHLIYPNQPTIGEKLPAAKGKLTLQSASDKRYLLSYQIEVDNRKIIGKEKKIIDGKTYEVYIHTYQFIQKTVLRNAQVLSTLEEEVTEWLIPDYGLVKQNRDGTMRMTSAENEPINLKHQSTVLTIQ